MNTELDYTNPHRRGNCYVTCEALYHLLGGKRGGWKPYRVRWNGDTHWWLQHTSGVIVDPTANQFVLGVPYDRGRAGGFLTREPSKRAVALMEKLLWQ